MNAYVGQVLSAHLALFQCEGDSTFSQGLLGTAGEPDPLGAVPVTFP